jgi:hypothetical protein
MMPISDHFMPIPPRHRRALEMLAVIALQPNRDILGAIGTGALLDEDEPFTLEQIVLPLSKRGLIEDLSHTELGAGGLYFIRITELGKICLGLGYMLREPRRTSPEEIKKYLATDSSEQTELAKTLQAPVKSANPYDPNEEKEAIA